MRKSKSNIGDIVTERDLLRIEVARNKLTIKELKIKLRSIISKSQRIQKAAASKKLKNDIKISATTNKKLERLKAEEKRIEKLRAIQKNEEMRLERKKELFKQLEDDNKKKSDHLKAEEKRIENLRAIQKDEEVRLERKKELFQKSEDDNKKKRDNLNNLKKELNHPTTPTRDNKNTRLTRNNKNAQQSTSRSRDRDWLITSTPSAPISPIQQHVEKEICQVPYHPNNNRYDGRTRTTHQRPSSSTNISNRHVENETRQRQNRSTSYEPRYNIPTRVTSYVQNQPNHHDYEDYDNPRLSNSQSRFSPTISSNETQNILPRWTPPPPRHWTPSTPPYSSNYNGNSGAATAVQRKIPTAPTEDIQHQLQDLVKKDFHRVCFHCDEEFGSPGEVNRHKKHCNEKPF